MASKPAINGWLIEVRSAATSPLNTHYLVAGWESARDAEKAVRRHPGISRDDSVLAQRALSRRELEGLGLKAEEIRKYVV
jgi:hypothetical protein